MKSKPRKLILNINYLPVLNPDIVTAVALMSLFAFVNIEFGFTTMLLSHIMFSIPYVILSVLPKVRAFSFAVRFSQEPGPIITVKSVMPSKY